MKSVWAAYPDDKIEFGVRSLVEKRALGRLVLSLLKRVVFARPVHRWPLQCVLFDQPEVAEEIVQRIEAERPTSVYFDTVRCLPFILKIRERYPELRLVCDFDDLMSRRMELVRKLKGHMSLGYLNSHVWKPLREVLESQAVSQFLLRLEMRSLIHAEDKIVAASDAVVLVSSVDVRVLRDRLPEQYTGRVHTAPPPCAMRKPVEIGSGPYRFVFVGSDRQLQNRLSIEYLLKLWRDYDIQLPLYIYGRQTVTQCEQKNVFWPGFVRDIEEVYARDSILLSPAILGGGVKTKMVEAIGNGCLSIGNETAFEGVDVPDNHLAVPEAKLPELLLNLPAHFPELLESARRLEAYCKERHSFERHQEIWRSVFVVGERAKFLSIAHSSGQYLQWQ
jgi:hypothetical protein